MSKNVIVKSLDNASGKAEQAVSVFTTVIDGLNKNNSELLAIKEQALAKIEFYKNIAENADASIAKNSAIIQKTQSLLN